MKRAWSRGRRTISVGACCCIDTTHSSPTMSAANGGGFAQKNPQESLRSSWGLSGDSLMQLDLIQITTRDGVRLDGTLQMPAQRSASAWPVDGFCMIHGTGGNFYSSTLFDAVTEQCLKQGCAVLRVNTRGHDGISNAV